MSDSDLTTFLRDHRMCSVSMWIEAPVRHYCSCRQWESTASAPLHGHDEFVVHLADVLSGVYAITPLADTPRLGIEPDFDNPQDEITWLRQNRDHWVKLATGQETSQ